MVEFQRLSDVADLTVGYVGTMGKEYTESGVKFLRSLNIKPFSFDLSDLKYIPEEFNNKLKKSELHTNDVVIVRTGVPGTCAVIPPELDGSNCADLVIVRPDITLIDPYYLCAFINSLGRAQVSNVKVGAVQKHFNVTSAEDMQIPIIDISEQKTVAKLLCNMNDKISNNNAICSDLEAMAKLLYDYWFVQFDFPDENGKPYKSSGGKMVWNEEMKREIPEGWGMKPLSELCSFMNGINYDKNEVGDKKYRIVNVRNITASSLLLDDSDFDEIILKSSQAERYLISDNDILIARSGTPGASRLLLNNDGNTIFCGFIIRCVPKDTLMRYYLTYVLKNLEGTNATKTGGSILQNVSQDTLGRVKTLIPDHNTLLAFTNTIENYHLLMQNTIFENQQLASLRDFLLPMLMNGQVKVDERL